MEQAAAMTEPGRRHPFPTPHRPHPTHAECLPEVTHASIVSKLGLRVPNLAPDVDFVVTPVIQDMDTTPQSRGAELYEDMRPAQNVSNAFEPKKKKYAKEAWPGRKPTMGSLLV